MVDEYEKMIGRDDFHENTINYENVDKVRDDVVDDHDDDAMEFHDDIGIHIGVQHVTNTILLIIKSANLHWSWCLVTW